MLTLILSRRFGPLFVTQFLGAFNDNLFKTAFIFLVAFRLRADDPAGAATMATLATGVFILPFFLFSGLAGEIADSRDKAMIARAPSGRPSSTVSLVSPRTNAIDHSGGAPGGRGIAASARRNSAGLPSMRASAPRQPWRRS